jgi:hypothetical protein
MVGFIKELVDEQGAADLTRASLTGTAKRGSRFETMTITPRLSLKSDLVRLDEPSLVHVLSS